MASYVWVAGIIVTVFGVTIVVKIDTENSW